MCDTMTYIWRGGVMPFYQKEKNKISQSKFDYNLLQLFTFTLTDLPGPVQFRPKGHNLNNLVRGPLNYNPCKMSQT